MIIPRDTGGTLARAGYGQAARVPQTDEERAQALRSMISYSGRYRVEDNKVITKVEIAWNEAWVGGE